LPNTKPGHEKLQSGGSAELGVEAFDLILRKSIDEVFKYALGEGGAQAIMFHLKLNEYWENPKEFHVRLVSVIRGGALVLESLIIKDLFRKLGVEYEELQPIDFWKRIANAKKFYEEMAVSGAGTK
jgi:hypothetical protein